MKRIIIIGMYISFSAFTPVHAYTITNSAQSTVPVAVAVTLGDQPSNIKNKASYILQPGQKGAWNQNEIREKLKREDLAMWIYPHVSMGKWSDPVLIKIDKMPIKAALEIVVTKMGTDILEGQSIVVHELSTIKKIMI